jgi:hypothetical protein
MRNRAILPVSRRMVMRAFSICAVVTLLNFPGYALSRGSDLLSTVCLDNNGQHEGGRFSMRESQLKRCYKCKGNLPLDDFVKDTRSADGYSAICRPCERARSKEKHQRHSERHIYRGMIKRCYDTASQAYQRYGAKGITVADEWRGKGGFERWLAYMGTRPSFEYSLDRYPNNDGNYEPGNVRWATGIEQNRNRGDFNTLIPAFNESLTAPEWSERTGIQTATIQRRIELYGFTPERALTEPVKANGNPCLITFQGRTQRRAAWAHELNIKPRRLESLLTKYSVEEAFGIAAKEGNHP